MTDVWRTRGPKYHRRQDCPGIRDGQSKAASEGKRTYSPERVSLSSLHQVSNPQACQRCWREDPAWESWLPIALRTELHSGSPSGSPWEVTFLEQVLMRIPLLEPAQVSAQYEVERQYESSLFPDFVIRVPGRQPIALEVDGAQKSDNPRPDERERSNRRDHELEKLGWRVLHFTNSQVIHETGWCRQRIIDVLQAAENAAAPSHPTSKPPTVAAPTTAQRSSMKVMAVVGTLLLALAAIAFVWNETRTQANQGVAPLSGGSCASDFPIKGQCEW